MPKFIKKPIEIDAIQWNGKNTEEVTQFIISGNGECYLERRMDTPIFIKTLEGTMQANKYDWVIKGVNGEFYPCKPDIFVKSYVRNECNNTQLFTIQEILNHEPDKVKL